MPLSRPAFTLKDEHALSVVGLQSDVGVERVVHPQGALFQLVDPERALELCRLVLNIASVERPDLIVLPELSVPRDALDEVVSRVQQFQFSTVLLAGIEGIHAHTYSDLVTPTGEPLDIDPGSGSCVNALLTVVKDGDGSITSFRAKRLASAVENNQVNACLGTSHFRTLELGPRPIRVLPLICAEFRSTIWERVRDDVGNAPIDVVVVVQMNDDPDQAHPSVALTDAFALGAPYGSARFVLANSATLPHASDGATYLIYPPTQLRPPTYEHTRTELWHVPRAIGYSGFRLPDKSGCVWKMSMRLHHGPTDAYQAIPCRGSALRVWRPTNRTDQGGLGMGLMRTRAAALLSAPAASTPNANPSVREHLDVGHGRCVAAELSETSAASCLYWASVGSDVGWLTVEGVVGDLVESGALLGAGNQQARLVGSACNCEVNGRGVAVLHAPNETEALSTRFRMEYCMPPHSLPRGAVTLGVNVASLGADTRVVGERIRADRITRGDRELQGGPPPRSESSVDLNALNFHSCELRHLRNLYALATDVAATQLQQLLPEVFA